MENGSDRSWGTRFWDGCRKGELRRLSLIPSISKENKVQLIITGRFRQGEGSFATHQAPHTVNEQIIITDIKKYATGYVCQFISTLPISAYTGKKKNTPEN